MRNFLIVPLLLLFMSCKTEKTESIKGEIPLAILNLTQAQRLVSLPINCVEVEFPNKLGQTIGGVEDLQSPKELHPAFYGCFDWHSSVHGHWSLVSLLKQFPQLENASEIKKKLLGNISKENIQKEPENQTA